MSKEKKNTSGEKTYIKSTGFSAFYQGSHVAAVDVKEGRIVRIRPLPYDWKYKPEEFRPWKIEARGKVFQTPLKTSLGPFGLGYKKSIFSPNRIMYPLKRVDWDPEGERNTKNRGKSGYVRISWDEATDLIAKELRRVIKKYGPSAILAQIDGHGEGKVVHSPHGCSMRLLDLLGGYTMQVRNPDSWEGWYWGAKHMWGGEPFGLMDNPTNLYSDVAKNSDMLLFWGCDPTTNTRGFGPGDMASRFSYWYKELGIKQIYICPDLNYGAAVHGDKWIPILPNTDAALQLSIAYLWITEDSYDKEYIESHSVGFDKFKDYVLGREDGIAKTPQWASKKTTVPVRIIKALARQWAKKRTTIMHCLGGPYIRGAYSHEPARLEVALLAMQGLGKPGVHQFSILNRGTYGSETHPCFPSSPGGIISNPSVSVRAAYRGYHPFPPYLPKQMIPKTMIHDAILNGSFTIYGSSLQSTGAEEQFVKYEYPAEGCSPIHMIWSDTPCLMTCWNDSNRNAEAYQHPSIEFFLVQHPRLENDTLYADIILPVNSKFEERDISTDTESITFDTVFIEEKCIEPLGESKSDYETVCAIAEKVGLLEEYTEGKSVDEWIELGFDTCGVPERGLLTWEEFKKKQYYVVPIDPNWEQHPAGLYEFYKDPDNHPLTTPTGKIEFESTAILKHFPNDKERPPVPHWIEKSDYHDERLTSKRVSKYPLLCQSNHPRWRVHAQLDDISWNREIETCKVKGPDGYLYEPCWIHPLEAEKRHIKNGEIVKIFNERGGVLCGAYVTERIMPGVAYVDHGARYDPIVEGELDRGGAINTITPHNTTSKNAAGMVTNGFLVEVEGVNLDELSRLYPQVFKRKFDQSSGLILGRILERGEKE